MGLGRTKRQKIQDQLALPGMERSESPNTPGEGIEAHPASHETGEPATEGLMEWILQPENLKQALKRVIQNRGAGGVDGMTVKELPKYLKTHWPKIREELFKGEYRPQAVKRVEIPKPTGGTRQLGIPTALDRFVQQAILQVLQARWDGTFSDASFGFRPGRNAHQAVKRAQRFADEGHFWVVDLDLEKFFDRVNHDQLMGLIAKREKDKRLLKLIRAFLNAGVMEGGLVGSPSDEGVPQGGPLSPLLSNLALDQLDHELERRGHRFVRYADDCNVYVRSERAGRRVMESVTRFIERRLKLRVNTAKSAVALCRERKFLGFSLLPVKGRFIRRLAPATIRRFKDRVREITRRARGMSLQQSVKRVSVFLRGWNAYFGQCQTPSVLEKLNAWIRHRFRKVLWRQWKNARQRYRKLRQLGLDGRKAGLTAGSRYGSWRSSDLHGMKIALSKGFFEKAGLATLVVTECA